jgi:hypothetical protein
MSSRISLDNNNKYSFNNNLKKSFGEKCLISKLDIDECERAHIIPISICKESGLDNITFNKSNGLIINRIFHTQFEIEGGKSPDFSFKYIGPDENNIMMDKYEIILGGKYSNKNLLLNNYTGKIIKLYKSNWSFINFHKCIFDISNGIEANINFNLGLLPALYLWKNLNSNIYKKKTNSNLNTIKKKIGKKKIGKKKLLSSNKNISKFIPGNWIVKEILKHRKINNKYEYLIKWNNSWVGKNSKIAKTGLIIKKDKNKVFVKWEQTWEPSGNIPKLDKQKYHKSINAL